MFNILILIHLPHQCCQMISIFKARLGKNIFFSVQSPDFQKLFLASFYVLALFNLLTFFFFPTILSESTEDKEQQCAIKIYLV